MSKASRLFVYLCLPCLALSLALTALANSVHFAGTYHMTNVTKQGDMVQMKLSLRVVNYSGAEVTGATISLKSSLPHASSNDTEHAAPAGLAAPAAPGTEWEKSQPTFQGVTLHVNEHKKVAPLEATFTVPALEYEQWIKGARPNFVIEFQNAEGKTVQEPVELVEHP